MSVANSLLLKSPFALGNTTRGAPYSKVRLPITSCDIYLRTWSFTTSIRWQGTGPKEWNCYGNMERLEMSWCLVITDICNCIVQICILKSLVAVVFSLLSGICVSCFTHPGPIKSWTTLQCPFSVAQMRTVQPTCLELHIVQICQLPYSQTVVCDNQSVDQSQ